MRRLRGLHGGEAMNRHRRGGALVIIALLGACSSSTAPAVPGSWKVTITGMTGGTVSPSSFTLPPSSNPGSLGTLPVFTYAGKTFDSAGTYHIGRPKDTTIALGYVYVVADTAVGVRLAHGITNNTDCFQLGFAGIFNAAKDTLNATILTYSSDASSCLNTGTLTAVKQP